MWQLATIAYTILALELTLIRWMSQQIRVFAYFTNVLLIAAFLGIGIGMAFSRYGKGLIHAFLPSLFALAVILRYSDALGLMFLSFPDRAISMWGADGAKADETFATNLVVIMVLFSVTAWLFLCLGARLGELFASAPPLRAYTADLTGSLAGVAVAVALAALSTTPPWWIALSVLPVLLWHTRTRLSLLAFAGAVLFAALSIEGARFSPYNRIDLKADGSGGHVLSANRDHHQVLVDLSAARRAAAPQAMARDLTTRAAFYEMPFRAVTSRRAALIVGAGTGNDVAAALRAGFTHVDAVEIDPVIGRIGRELHPEKPYSDPRVTLTIADARHFINDSREQYDAVCFGLLDSHSMFSSMSTLRLDNYVYTTDALRAAWQRVSPGGVLSISFMIFRQRFIAERIARSIEIATGEAPLVVASEGHDTFAFIRARGISRPELARRLGATPVEDLNRDIRVSTDDWPFFYIRPGIFPAGYVAVLSAILLLAMAASRAAFGKGFYSRRRFDLPLFLFGAAFLLIETRSITNLSLLFGSTWIVNAAVFGDVLLLATIANAAVRKGTRHLIVPSAVLLLVSVTGALLVTNSTLSLLPLGTARAAGIFINVLPIGFAGVLFSALLARSPDPVASLGSNLLGAVLGGILEYGSMIAGLRLMAGVAGLIYLLALILARKRLLSPEPAT
jgi:SAM-dependent methyltransferase